MTPGSAAGGKAPLRVLIVEDREDDLLLLLRELDRAGYAVTHEWVESPEALAAALERPGADWEVVVSDYSLPAMTAHDVLAVLGRIRPDLPCIVVSGTISEEAAVDVLRAGARDFVVKERLARLLPAIEREIQESHERRRLREAEATLHETRERMQFALETVGIGFWEWDLRSGQVIWSDVAERLHGLQPGAFGGSLDAMLACVHLEDHQPIRDQAAGWVSAPGDTRLEYRTLWPDGSVHWMLGIGRTLLDGGAPVRAVGVVMDTTAQKRLEDQFRQAQKMESIGSLAGGIAHDFNNLLTVISGCCDLAAARVTADPDAAESIEGIRAATASASALTRQLLTFSRRQIVMPRLLDLNATVAAFGKILRRLVEENVQIRHSLSPDLPRVRADPGQIEQVLLNLVANARDAMPEGGTLFIETRSVRLEGHDPRRPPDVPAGAYVRLAVSDTGSGLSPGARAHLFEPFYTTKAPGRGTGLGLSTVYGIVQQSDGHIVVESEPGSGATFSIYLPVASGPADARSAEEKGQAINLTGSETILVVEDNGALRRLNERILQRYGYTVLVAANGAQAQRVCTEYRDPIHLVLVDVVMPGDSGPMVGEWIARHRPGTKIVYMSGYTGGEIDQHGVLGPGSVFLQKPFGVTQLARTVRQVLSAVDT